MAGSNGHASQTIPPTITRIITKDILEGSQKQLAWIANAESPVNQSVKIAKMLFRFDAEDNPDAVEVYGIGMIDNRAIGVRSTVRIADVCCIDEVMDVATWTEEIAEAESDDDEEDDDPEPAPTPSPATIVVKPPQPAPIALPSPSPSPSPAA
jgi:hypothetical protein